MTTKEQKGKKKDIIKNNKLKNREIVESICESKNY